MCQLPHLKSMIIQLQCNGTVPPLFKNAIQRRSAISIPLLMIIDWFQQVDPPPPLSLLLLRLLLLLPLLLPLILPLLLL